MRVVRVMTLSFLLAAAAPAFAQEPPHTLGACGAAMTGYDGRSYTCEANRRPACNPDGSRCVCVERRDCGGRQDEPF